MTPQSSAEMAREIVGNIDTGPDGSFNARQTEIDIIKALDTLHDSYRKELGKVVEALENGIKRADNFLEGFEQPKTTWSIQVFTMIDSLKSDFKETLITIKELKETKNG